MMVGMKLRFSLRDLLWLAVLIAMALAWWTDRSRLANQMAENRERLINFAYHPEMLSPKDIKLLFGDDFKIPAFDYGKSKYIPKEKNAK
jgi:hypothetical protein